jgi:hypothetical protein
MVAMSSSLAWPTAIIISCCNHRPLHLTSIHKQQTSVHRLPSDIHQTLFARSSDFHLTFVGRSSYFYMTSSYQRPAIMTSFRSNILTSYHSTILTYWHHVDIHPTPSNLRLASVWRSSDLCPTSVRCHSSSSSHHILKPYIVLKFCN